MRGPQQVCAPSRARRLLGSGRRGRESAAKLEVGPLMKFAVVVFPGTSSDRDCGWVIDQVVGAQLQYLWHKDADVNGCDCVILRGGFAGGRVVPSANPNGSLHNIAGIINKRGNVLGMMPHPERCAEPELGGADGLKLFRSVAGSALKVLVS